MVVKIKPVIAVVAGGSCCAYIALNENEITAGVVDDLFHVIDEVRGNGAERIACCFRMAAERSDDGRLNGF